MTTFSRLPSKQPFFSPAGFPELKELVDNWQAIREEALLMQHHIKTAQNLGLSTPNDERCFIEVDGQVAIFDETYVHWAQNGSDHTRIILFCDIERPILWSCAQAVNGWVGHILMSAAASPNDGSDRTGFINRIFKYVHAIRDAGHRLKKRNRQLYYVMKYALIALIFILIILTGSG